MSGISLVEGKDISFSEGDLPCLIVYSDQKHVDYINDILSFSEESLRTYGFKPQRLSCEIKSDQDYLSKITSLIESCALVLVILDGLRPNVSFEFGCSKALKKPIIVVRSKGAVISVKTLYKQISDMGLTEDELKKLKEPILDPAYHISDFAGKHVPAMDRTAKENEKSHPSAILKNEIAYKKEVISQEIQKIETRNKAPNILNEFLPHLKKIIELSLSDAEFELSELNDAINEIYRISGLYGQEVPKEIVILAGSTFMRLGEEQLKQGNEASAAKSIKSAREIYDRLSTLV